MRYKIVPKGEVPPVSEKDLIVHEKDLPYPYVHYPSDNGWRGGGFFAFQERRDSPLYYCSCQKKGLENYLRLLKDFGGIPMESNRIMVRNFIQQLQYKDNLCHVCNKVCPKFGFTTDIRSFGKFFAIYGNYIIGLTYEYGIDGLFGDIFAPELIPSDIASNLSFDSGYFDYKEHLNEESKQEFIKYCENVIRSRMGYYLKGQRWKTETELLQLVKKIYPDYTVIHQYPLQELWADIYIHELQLVIEYQGKQHFEPIPFFGGEDAFKKRLESDERKANICKNRKLGIIYFTYKEELTEKLVKEKISSYLKNNKQNETAPKK